MATVSFSSFDAYRVNAGAVLQPGAGTASALPMRDWMPVFERVVGSAYAAGGAGRSAGHGAAAASSARAGQTAAHAHGEHHGR